MYSVITFEAGKNSLRVKLGAQPHSITNLYDMVAVLLGQDSEKCHYDCTKLEVSTDIVDAIEATYRDGADNDDWKMTFGMHWCCFGPKVNEELPKNTVEVYDGFIQ